MEEKLAKYIGKKHGITCANGIDALSLTLMMVVLCLRIMMDCEYVDLCVTEDVCQRVLALPMHPYMTEQEVESATEVVRGYKEELDVN